MAIRNAYKARERGLQFEAMLVFMGLAFLGEREGEKIRLPFPVPKTKSVRRISPLDKEFVYESDLKPSGWQVRRLGTNR